MKPQSADRTRRATLALAIALALGNASCLYARTVPAGPPVVIDGEQLPTEEFIVEPAAILRLINGATIANVSATNASVEVTGSSVIATSGSAFTATNSSILTLTDATIASVSPASRSTGLVLTSELGASGFGTGARATLLRTQVSGGGYAATITSDGTIDATDSHFVTQRATGYGMGLFAGTVNLMGGSTVTGQRAGIQIANDFRAAPNNGRTLNLDGSSVQGVGGAALLIDTLDTATPTDVTISLSHGASLLGAGGVAIDMRDRTDATVDVASSDIEGDIVMTGGATARVALHDAATWTGAINGNAAITIAADSLWTSGKASDIASLTLDGGTVSPGRADAVDYANLHVRGALSGSGGNLLLNSRLDAGGPIDAQGTDRLLIEGDVTTTGTTFITVRPRGTGASTDVNQDGVIDANEGLSLVQVGGASRADAFALAGGYVAAGPFQYTLRAFGPGEADQAQNALTGGPLNWDYRLGNRYVCQTDCTPVDPGAPDPGDGGDPGTPENPGTPGDPGDGSDPVGPETPGARVAVVPQLPSYLSAPAALLTYGDMMSDGLHQRLGDIRQGASTDPVGGEVFARYLGGQLRYSSNLSFQRYGYDFDQQVNALQLGGSLIALDGDNGSLRAGWAADKGTTRVTPNAADGNSSAKYHANGVSAWITWQQGNGFWVDGVIGATRYRGDVGTDLRGSDVGNLRAHGWTTSVEAGMPIAIGGDWTVEPRFQLKHQQLNFRDFTDADGLDVRLGTAKQTSATLGGRIARTAQPRFMPYASLDLTHTSNGDPNVDVSSEAFNASDRFGSGRVGNSYRVAAGAVSQLGEHVQLYGEGNYQHFVGSYGVRGWAGNVGIRVSF